MLTSSCICWMPQEDAYSQQRSSKAVLKVGVHFRIRSGTEMQLSEHSACGHARFWAHLILWHLDCATTSGSTWRSCRYTKSRCFTSHTHSKWCKDLAKPWSGLSTHPMLALLATHFNTEQCYSNAHLFKPRLPPFRHQPYCAAVVFVCLYSSASARNLGAAPFGDRTLQTEIFIATSNGWQNWMAKHEET